MTDHHDERLRALLHDAVADVEPHDRLADVRRRTRASRPATRWAPVLLGIGAVTATVVAATYVVSGLGDQASSDRDADVAGSATTGGVTTAAAGIYYVGDTPTGPRLFREFQAVTATSDPEEMILVALRRLTEDVGPRDPDYRTAWPVDAFDGVRVEDDRIIIELGSEAALRSPRVEVGQLGVQQAVYTAEAALGETLPVMFELDGAATRRVLGARVPAVVQRDRSSGVTAPVNITDPAEGLAVEGDTLAANGTMAPSVAEVSWALRGDGGVMASGSASPIDITGPDARATLGAPGWETGPIDISELPPGSYELTVSVTDIGQTSDRPTEFVDTRSISVR